MNDPDWKAPPADFAEEERWKSYATGIDELDLRDVCKRLNLSRPQKFGVTGGLRYIDFAECQMVAVEKEDLVAIWKARADKLDRKATEVRAETGTLDCALCGAAIDHISGAHNGEPVTEGHVCTACNTMKVIPARLNTSRQQSIPEE